MHKITRDCISDAFWVKMELDQPPPGPSSTCTKHASLMEATGGCTVRTSEDEDEDDELREISHLLFKSFWALKKTDDQPTILNKCWSANVANVAKVVNLKNTVI